MGEQTTHALKPPFSFTSNDRSGKTRLLRKNCEERGLGLKGDARESGAARQLEFQEVRDFLACFLGVVHGDVLALLRTSGGVAN